MYQIRDISTQLHPSNFIFSLLGLHYYHANQIPVYYKLYNTLFILAYVGITLYNLINDNTEVIALYNNTVIIPLICYYLLHMINMFLFISLYINTYINHIKIKKIYTKLSRIDFLLVTCRIQIGHNNGTFVIYTLLTIAVIVGIDLGFYFCGLKYNNLLLNYINFSVLVTLHYSIYLLLHFIYVRFHCINQYMDQYIKRCHDNANILFPHCNVINLSLNINTEAKHKARSEHHHNINVESLLNDYKMNIKTYDYIHQELEESQQRAKRDKFLKHNPILNPAVLNSWMKKAALIPTPGPTRFHSAGKLLQFSLQPVVSTFNFTLSKIREKRLNRIKPVSNVIHVTEIQTKPVITNLKILTLIHNSLFRLCVSINTMYNRLILLLLIDHFVALIYKLYFPTYLIIVTRSYDYVLLFHSIYWILIRLALLFVLIYMFYQTQYELEQMTHHLRRHKVEFTSYGIFNLDCSLLYSLPTGLSLFNSSYLRKVGLWISRTLGKSALSATNDLLSTINQTVLSFIFSSDR
ncbi:hypothetical protein M8J76_007469 [Diaphorina citri]|nr:hypothetical protein M8J76_007469 [Diaphorina citri]